MKFSKALLYLAIITVIAFAISGYGYRWGIWSLGTAFTILTYSTYSAIAITAVSILSFLFLRKKGAKVITTLSVAFVLTAVAATTALYWQQRAQSVPPIHDITTDLQNPPEFSAMVRLRADAPNPPEYAGEETAEQQREAYPGLEPLVVDDSLQVAMDEAVRLVLNRGWQIVAINRNEGRIEATEILPWFGFKDDVVLRFTETTQGTRIDMRSKSRVGRSDVGVNAKRIERFLEDLEMRLE
jgi:uncharacterized protein (DUF1499 family)